MLMPSAPMPISSRDKDLGNVSSILSEIASGFEAYQHVKIQVTKKLTVPA